MSMLDRLRAKDKTGLYVSGGTQPMYETGIIGFDFLSGYLMPVRNKEGEIVSHQKMLGNAGGSTTTVIGRSGVAKTTFLLQAAAAIIEKYPDSMCYHFDGETSTNWNRILSVTNLNPATIRDRYVLKQNDVTVEAIREVVIQIAEDRRNNPKDKKPTGMVDEFGEEIYAFDPVVVIIDSVPTIGMREFVDKEETQGQTHAMRRARAISDLLGSINTHIKEANIMLFLVNHIKPKSALVKTQAQVAEMKIDETMPGGEAPIYYANTILRIISSDKYYTHKGDDFDGFLAIYQLVKSRIAPSGSLGEQIYEKRVGFSNLRTMLHVSKELGLIGGRNPSRYLMSHPDVKFDTRDMSTITDNPDVLKALTESVVGAK